MEDARLAADAASGDQRAFEELVTRYRSYVYVIAYKIVLNEEEALDVTQDVCLKLVEKIQDYGGRGSFRGWLGSIAARTAIDSQRRSRRREIAIDGQSLERYQAGVLASQPEDPRRRLENAQRHELVEGCMGRLSAQQRAVLTLRLKESMRPKEIARRLDIPEGQVRSQLARAVARVRKALAEEIV